MSLKTDTIWNEAFYIAYHVNHLPLAEARNIADTVVASYHHKNN